jgi:putative transposase
VGDFEIHNLDKGGAKREVIDAQLIASTLATVIYRWRKEYGGLKMDQAKRLKELEKENGKLKRLVAELALDKQILKDIAEGNF